LPAAELELFPTVVAQYLISEKKLKRQMINGVERLKTR
jgi:hypothetical protein